MSNNIDLFADLSLSRGASEFLITAEGNNVTVHFKGFHAFCREYKYATAVAGHKRFIIWLDSICKAHAICIGVKISKITVVAFGPGTTHIKRNIILGLISLYSKFLST